MINLSAFFCFCALTEKTDIDNIIMIAKRKGIMRGVVDIKAKVLNYKFYNHGYSFLEKLLFPVKMPLKNRNS